MRKLIYSIGVTLFLMFMSFHVTTSLTNPYFGVSMEALAQGSGSGGSGDCFYIDENGVPVVSCGADGGCCWRVTIYVCYFTGSPTDYAVCT